MLNICMNIRQVKRLLQFLKKHATMPITITNPEYLVRPPSQGQHTHEKIVMQRHEHASSLARTSTQ
jgi:hypothetical protein